MRMHEISNAPVDATRVDAFLCLPGIVFHIIPFTCPLDKLKNVNPALHIIQTKASEKPFPVALCYTEYGGSLFF